MHPALATTELTVNQWGIVLLAIFGLASFATPIASLILGRLDKRREEERIARGEAEPRHTPGIDQKIDARNSATEARLREEIAKVEAKQAEETRQIHGRISKMRDEQKADWDRTSATITRSVERIADKVDTVAGSVSEMTGELRHMNQQLHVTDQSLRQHIKDDK